MAFISSAMGPRVAAACAHASLASLFNDGGNEGISHGDITKSSNNGMIYILDIFLSLKFLSISKGGVLSRS